MILHTTHCSLPRSCAVYSNNLQLFHFGTDGNKEPFSIVPLDLLQSAIACILDVRNHPILIHCSKGTHRTGCLIGCMRKVQYWSLTSILAEYQRFAGGKPRVLDQQSIELFNPNQVPCDPKYLPAWLRM
uniref:Tyrosine specific protein phosphatases domain-containing protein n=1 Tax=Spongospora subterranea TaxID=70186 RepID=A0A0H5R4R8_9EUKA|eukprot:CRZ03084.1 hypothetical protein [Spongospora subterranea]